MWRSDPEPRAVSVAVALLTVTGGSLILLGLLAGVLALPVQPLPVLPVLLVVPAGALMILTAARLGPGTRRWWAAGIALHAMTPSVAVLDHLVTGDRISAAAFLLPAIGLACLLAPSARRYAFATRIPVPEEVRR